VAGGEYLIRVESNEDLFPPTVRKIRIRTYQDRRYFTTVDFGKETYSPGDRVLAKVKVRSAGGSALKFEEIEASYSTKVSFLLIYAYSLNKTI
jgi:translation initiation factor 1 (eIF-1/SUI1)